MPLSRLQKGLVVSGAGAAAIGGVVWWALNRPSITLVSAQLSVATGYAVWAASGMNPNHVYVIGAVLQDGSLYYNPNNDTRVNSESADGVYSLNANMVGATLFVLYDQTTGGIAASMPCKVTS